MNISDAVRVVSKVVGCLPSKVSDLNSGRYKLVEFKDEIVLVLFKNAPFYTLNRDVQGKGFGESINRDDLKKAIWLGVRFVYIMYEDRKLYRISVENVVNNGVIRCTNAEGKFTYSFDIKLLERVN